jgi:hypothetical protein
MGRVIAAPDRGTRQRRYTATSPRLEKMTELFKLINSETKSLTPELAQRFKAMLPSPTERMFDPARAKMLREKAEAGQLVTFNWATAKVGDKEYRVNGQHSSAVLAELNGEFPQGLKVHMDTYQVDNNEGLAVLFRQFDARKSGRTPMDVSGAYQGLYTDLAGVARGAAKLAVEGVAWYDKNSKGCQHRKVMIFTRSSAKPVCIASSGGSAKTSSPSRRPS